jgi:beta-carotene hydroxylase
MLRNRHDIRTLGYLAVTVGLFLYQWSVPGLVNWWLYPLTLFMSYTAAVMSHNHNHHATWKATFPNLITSYVIGIFYGHPAIGWVPTHNQNHHKFNNREGDLSISPRFFKRNHLLALITYPTVTSLAQQAAIRSYLRELYGRSKRQFWSAISEYAVFFGLMILAFVINWKKALLLLLIPQQIALFLIQCTNYLQHIEADKYSRWNHSRNFEGWWLNTLLFNNGYHTVHHHKPGVHWSQTSALHAEVRDQIDPALLVPSMPYFVFDTYFAALVGLRRVPAYQPVNLPPPADMKPEPSAPVATAHAR